MFFIDCASSAAVYGGVGGYAVYRPGLVGLTPTQFRELRFNIGINLFKKKYNLIMF